MRDRKLQRRTTDQRPSIEVLEGRRLLSATFVDLVPQILSSPTGTITIGGKHAKKQSAVVKVIDEGTAPGKGFLSLNLYASSDQTLDPTDILLLALPLKKVNIRAGKSLIIRLSGKLPATVPSGSFFLLADVNPLRKIAESDRSNDVAASTQAVTVSNPAIPPAPRLAGLLAASQLAVVVGQPELIHFHVPVAGATASTTVELDEVDSSGNVIGKIIDLADDGSPLNGDAQAKDGTFSGVTTVGMSAPGQRFLVAKVSDPTLANSLLTPSLTMSGIATPSQAQVNADVTDFNNISQVADNAKASGALTQDVLDAVMAALQSDSNVVQGSILRSNSSIEWKDTDGIGQGVDMSLNDGELGLGDSPFSDVPIEPASAAAAPAASPAIVPLDSTLPTDTTKNALVLAPFAFQWGSNDPGLTIASILEAKGYNVTSRINANFSDDNVSNADYEALDQYAAIVFCGHAGIAQATGELGIATGDTVNSFTTNLNLADLLTGRMVIHDIPGVRKTYVFFPGFIEAHTASLDRSIVLLGECHSTQTSTMTDAFLGLGAAAVIGFNDTVQSAFSGEEGITAFQTLIQSTNNTVGDIPGINTARDPQASHALFQAVGDLSATLPQPIAVKNTDVYILYSWPQTQSDLDTNTTFLGNTAGYNLPGGPYLDWNGDNTGAGGSETVLIDIGQAWVDGKWSGSTTIKYGADWFTPAGGSGDAVVTVALEDKTTGQIYNAASKQISPGEETEGSMTVAGTLTLTLSGDPTNPSVSIQFN